MLIIISQKCGVSVCGDVDLISNFWVIVEILCYW